ncbi:MAG: imidazole glycerol phosphate synthase subunit HisF [Fimbriimonadaceae bacterium]
MLAKRIIACLDVADGRVTKGTHFMNLRDAGDPVELAARYSDEGADEIVFLDISASPDGKETVSEVVAQVARRVFVPLTVGGGIRSVADARRLLNSGADKVGVNSAAVARPGLIGELSDAFGAQCVVLAVDGRRVDDGWEVFVNGGRKSTGLDALKWAAEGQRLGAGEILLTSMDADGTLAGFDLALTAAVCGVTTIPVVASGGAGSAQDIVEVFENTEASAALAASIFHFDQTSISTVKELIRSSGIAVRPA